MQKNPIAVEAIGFFCSIGKLALVEGFRQVGQMILNSTDSRPVAPS